MISIKTCKVTAILNAKAANLVIEALNSHGFQHIYIQEGRLPILKKSRNLLNFLSDKRSLFSNPVKIVSVYVQSKDEALVLNLVASTARLYHPGQGSLFSEPCHLYDTGHMRPNQVVPFETTKHLPFVTGLVGVSVVVQRGEADPLARALLQSGLGSPCIFFGSGTGLREKIGLLRITIPAAKEILSVVVPTWDTARVVDMLIAVGRLHLPGRGFINTFPVNSGILNTKMTAGHQYQAARLDQVIAAIDSLSGNIDWRRSGFDEEEDFVSRRYIEGADLHLICNAGHGVSLVKAAMAAGCPGATIEPLRLLQAEGIHENQMSPARERSKMMIEHNRIHTILEAIEKAGAYSKEKQTIVFSQDIPKAFTYLRAKSSA